jgi:glycosyltransferase involved in cell wall biosynthesis
VAEPLITVVTPTWQRTDLVTTRCIPSVLNQDYPNVEHVVVADGQDLALGREIAHMFPAELESGRLKFAELDTHDHAYRWGHRARLRGLELAAGDVVAYLDDDNAYRPQHLRVLAAALAAAPADWGYSQSMMHGHGPSYIVGAAPPGCGSLDTSAMMHRTGLLDKATWRDEGQETVDWDLAERWLAGYASYVFWPEVTVDYYFSR